MVWAAVSLEEKSPLIFVPKGVIINKVVYIDKILKDGFMPWTSEMYPNVNWTFQQDGATSHTANLTQQWCRDHRPAFISKEEWPPNSPDLNVLGFCVWSVLEKKACVTPATSVNILKKRLVQAWSEIDQNILRASVEVPSQTKSCYQSQRRSF